MKKANRRTVHSKIGRVFSSLVVRKGNAENRKKKLMYHNSNILFLKFAARSSSLICFGAAHLYTSLQHSILKIRNTIKRENIQPAKKSKKRKLKMCYTSFSIIFTTFIISSKK